MSENPTSTPHRLRIWQQNLNASDAAQHHLLNSHLSLSYDVLAIQEPYIKKDQYTYAGSPWRVIYPTPHFTNASATRSVLLIRKALDTNSWCQLEFPSSDVTVVQFTGDWGCLTLFNIYNDGTHSRTL
ncbi:hypothetical protein BV25DRAFT_1796907, partial [Artomyces pyxidatus]